MGNDLFNTVAKATGLPPELITKELARVLEAKGIALADVNMDQLREALADYLREVILQAKDQFADGIPLEEDVP